MTVSQTELEHREPDGETIVEVRNATVSFDMERGESRVLDDVSLDIYNEEILGLVGESGSGKSMFASSLLDAVVEPGILTGDITYHKPDGTAVDILGLSDAELKQLRWEEISMVFQGAMNSFNPTKTLRGHFEETLEAHQVPKDEGMERGRELLADLYLEPDRVLDSYPHELSGGMAQRTLIALSLVLEPNVLVMDEPTAALDLLMQRSILSLIESIQEKYGITIIFITHDLPLVAGLADRIAVMYSFQIIEVGPAAEIVRHSTHPYTRALLNAVPNLDAPLDEMKAIEGSSPDPVNVPEGCSYHPRCPMSIDRCELEEPELLEVDERHRSACFLWDEVDESISLSYEATDRGADIAGKQSEEALISLEDVEVHFEVTQGFLDALFGRPDVVHAVDGITLDIYENDIVALVGESGCGKTTLGKTVVAAEQPTGGSVAYRDRDVWKAKDEQSLVPLLDRNEEEISFSEIRRALQVVHQDPGSSLNPNRKVEAILSVPLKRWHSDMGRRERQHTIYTELERVGLSPPDDYASRYPHQLSGGEKQRIALIRALLMNPDLILADEAVSALDVSLRIEMMDLMLDLQETFDTSYVFVSHNLSNARYFAGNVDGRIAVMYLGEIVEIGPAEELIGNPRHPYTRVLKWATADLDAEQSIEEPPIRGIDIPDPVDPPTGCRFHTRCPEAREHCTQETPALQQGEDVADSHRIACFMEHGEDHPYWETERLSDEHADTIEAETQ